MRFPWCRMVLPAAAWLVLAGTARAGEPAPAKKEAALDARALANRINAHVQARWKAANVKPAPVADDAEFLRRVYLDIAGRIPRVQEIHQFLQDKRPDKRFLLIDKLLEDHGYVGNFTNIWRDLMIPQANNQFAQAFGPQMEAWLGRKLRENVPYDKIVRELLTADPIGNRGIVRPGQQRQVSTDPAVLAFYQANELKPENLASSTSRIFLGVRLECAQCHDHPFAAFTRDQFWQYAAFFAGIRPFQQQQGRFQPASYDPSIYEIKIPNSKPERTVKAKFLDGKDPKFAKDVDARALLAEWMTAADNPFFAKAAVNRLWAHFFGLGIIDPVDEPNPDNPPSHPELLDELAKQFALNKFDLKYLIKAIAYSDAYQRTSRQTHPTQADPRLFARMSVKGLSPEQLYDSLVLAVGYRDPNTTFNRGFVGNRFFGLQGEFRTKFANHADKRTEFQTSILQALSMMNGSFTADATSVTRSNTLAGVIDSPFMDTEGKLNALFLASLGRKMHPAEVSRLVRYVDKGGPSGDSAKALSDVFWALLNSSEFMFNH